MILVTQNLKIKTVPTVVVVENILNRRRVVTNETH
jgi:hypothetical protein